MAQTDVRLDRVTKRFGDVVAVDDLSLDIEHGEFFSMLGPSGCGKTTTLRMIAGFEDVTSGTVYLGEQDVTELQPYKRDVNTVFQNYALFPHLNVYENVAFGLRRRRVADSEIRRRVGEMLELVQLPGYDRRRTNQLSGGQQQRVALARALINHPRVLLLDEPLGALDLKLRKQMQLELKRIQEEVGITFVYVTHDQDEAMTMSNRIAVMRAGKVDQLGDPVQLYEQPKTEFVAGFLGVSNLLDGKVVGRGDRFTEIELVNGRRVRAVADGWATDTPVQVGVRPEKLRLQTSASVESAGGGSSARPDGDADSNVLEGSVTDASYVGVSTQYVVHTDAGQDVVVYSQNLDVAGGAEQHVAGERVRMSWNPNHTFVIKRADNAALQGGVEAT
ncbi:MAG: ABC transporter ATP-binding protein [Candidatus Limnocylindrales bacterium]